MTASRTATLAVGLRLRHDGETYTVQAIAGSGVTLRSARGGTLHVGIAALLTDPSTRLLVPEPPAEEGLGTLLSGLTAVETRMLRDRLGHVPEVLTGFRSGSTVVALAGEPRPDYHPARPLTARYQAKADELGVGVASVRRWVRRFREKGPAGLIDHGASATPILWPASTPAASTRALPSSTSTSTPAVPPASFCCNGWMPESRRSVLISRWRAPRDEAHAVRSPSSAGAPTPLSAARRGNARSPTAPLVPTDGCGRRARVSTCCSTPRAWTCSPWSR